MKKIQIDAICKKVVAAWLEKGDYPKSSVRFDVNFKRVEVIKI